MNSPGLSLAAASLAGVGWEHRQRPASTPGPKPIIDEWHFVPDSIEQARELYRVMVDAGTAPPRARQIVAWLIVMTPDRDNDVASPTTRRDFRRALAELGAPPWELAEEPAAAVG